MTGMADDTELSIELSDPDDGRDDDRVDDRDDDGHDDDDRDDGGHDDGGPGPGRRSRLLLGLLAVLVLLGAAAFVGGLVAPDRPEVAPTAGPPARAADPIDLNRFNELAARLRSLGGHAVTHYIKSILEQSIAGRNRPDLWLAASLLPREFWSAAYLCVLERAKDFLGND